MAKALSIELRHRSTGREVHVKRGHMAFLSGVKIVHRGLDSALVVRFAGNDDRFTSLKAGKPGGRVHPVCLNEHLLARNWFHADGLEVEVRHIRFAPVILHTRSDDDSLGPAIGNAGTLGDGHLHD